MKKRGQVTTFIIIGLILIILIIGTYAVYHFYLKSEFEKQLTLHSEIPRRIQPISEHMDKCVDSLTKEAIDIISLQGGYLNIPEEPLPTTPFTPLSSSLEIIPNSDLKTAIWFREQPNGIQITQVPTQEQIEKEIATYILNNFNTCLNLENFEQQGFTISLPSQIPTATVNLLEDAIQAQVDYPIEIQFEDITALINTHFSNYKTNFGKLYKLAKQIFSHENNKLFLENRTIDMLVAYQDIPYSGSDLSCTPKIWLKQDIIKKVKEELFNNIAAIRIINTNYEIQNDLYKYFEEDAIKGSHKDTNINFMYIPDWPTTIEITPSEDNILKSDNIVRNMGTSATAFVSQFLCLNHYHFIYTIKYIYFRLFIENVF